MLPKITAMFRLAKEPDLRFSASGMAVCSLYLVASEKYKEKETQLFISATAFSKTAEFIANVKKGQRVYVTGKIQTDSWEKDGQRQSKITMIIDSFEYVEKRDDSGASNQNNAPQQSYQSAQAPQQAPTMPDTSQFDAIEDEIPFAKYSSVIMP